MRQPRSAASLSTRIEVPVDTYVVVVGRGVLAEIGEIAERAVRAHRYALVSDETVAPHYAERVLERLGRDRSELFTVPAGEAQKTRARWAELTDAMLARGFGRDAAVVALGGGVVGDLAGFVAATYMRGVPVIQLPTSLLAMIDASVGGKTGVDTPAGKNLVGAFHQPAVVLSDPDVLATLPPEHLRAGMAEALKHGVVADAQHFDQVAREGAAVLADPADEHTVDLVAASIAIKADVVRRDEREGGLRKILNFGHTLGHAIEQESGYRLLHGEAVAIGMVLESTLAERLGLAARETAERIRAALLALGLPVEMPAAMDPERVLAWTRSDKKARGGVVEYALPATIGAMAGAESRFGIPVPDDSVLDLLRESAPVRLPR